MGRSLKEILDAQQKTINDLRDLHQEKSEETTPNVTPPIFGLAPGNPPHLIVGGFLEGNGMNTTQVPLSLSTIEIKNILSFLIFSYDD
jgi:hypothetical protein